MLQGGEKKREKERGQSRNKIERNGGGMKRNGMAWHGMAWHDMAWHGTWPVCIESPNRTHLIGRSLSFAQKEQIVAGRFAVDTSFFFRRSQISSSLRTRTAPRSQQAKIGYLCAGAPLVIPLTSICATCTSTTTRTVDLFDNLSPGSRPIAVSLTATIREYLAW